MSRQRWIRHAQLLRQRTNAYAIERLGFQNPQCADCSQSTFRGGKRLKLTGPTANPFEKLDEREPKRLSVIFWNVCRKSCQVPVNLVVVKLNGAIMQRVHLAAAVKCFVEFGRCFHAS